MSASHSPAAERVAVVLIGHGAPALDCPPRLIGELMGLQWGPGSGGHGHHHLEGRAAELDMTIRSWPRTPQNDPYKVGLEQVAAALRLLLPTELFAIGYNEFCRPTIAEAVEQVLAQGATRILVIPSMLTPGGVHSEIDIPKTLDHLRQAHRHARIEYVWPFEPGEVAQLLASRLDRAAGRAAPASESSQRA